MVFISIYYLDRLCEILFIASRGIQCIPEEELQ